MTFDKTTGLQMASPYIALVAGRCGGCKNWTDIGRFGICEVINFYGQSHEIANGDSAVAVRIAFTDDGSLLTRADFGCVLFAAKDAE
jgi:hypothetical protein